ncbi:MAG: hypothetical protein MI741_12440, partial [Rhodospirillales bacterium]|nr:hypothetical protein [Rhodospirillales bacterium]
EEEEYDEEAFDEEGNEEDAEHEEDWEEHEAEHEEEVDPYAPRDLAGLMVHAMMKIQCLADGRIFFTAPLIELPIAPQDLDERERLFVIDPQRSPAVRPAISRSAAEMLPAELTYCEVSADGRFLSIAHESGQVSVMSLISGAMFELQPELLDGDPPHLKTIPVWKSPRELTLVLSAEHEANPTDRPQVAIWTLSEQAASMKEADHFAGNALGCTYKLISKDWASDGAGAFLNISENSDTEE